MVINCSVYDVKKQWSVFITLCFCIVTLFFSSASGNAQTSIEIPTDSIWDITLIDELEVMSDEQRQWSAESLFATSENLFETNTPDTKPVLHNYWARFTLANTTENEQWLSFESYYWDYVTLYFHDSTGNVTKIPFGILSHPNNHKFLAQPQTEYEVLANFESSGQFRREANINLVVKSTLPALEKKTFTNYMDGIIFGIMFGLALYNLFLFISIRDRIYFWYTLYILSIAFSFMTLFASGPSKWTQFFTSDYPQIAFYLKKITDPILWIAYTNFARYFLVTKERFPIWDKILRVCIVFISLQFLINITGIYHFTGATRSLSWLLPVIISVLLAIYSYYKRYTKAMYFIVGQILIVLGFFITTMYYAGFDVIYFLPKTEFFNYFRSPNSYYFLSAVESIIFSFALADKYNILQKDITQVKIENEKEKQEALRLQELDTFKTRFYSNITHEFRTPLTVIQGMTETVKSNIKKNELNKVEESLTLINRNGQKLLGLVNEILDLAKLESGSMELQIHQTDIVPYVKYLSESFHSLAKSKNIDLTVCSEIDTLIMDVDIDKLGLVISNLLSNAIKFTSENGKIELHLNTIEQHNIHSFVIKVKDNGIGLTEKEQDHLFDRFYQVANTSNNLQTGTGIGLSITNEFVALMNGTISVDSAIRKGTTFTVEIPIINRAVKKDKSVEALEPLVEKVIPKHKTELSLEETTLELPLLLIIEDNEDVAHYLKTCLKEKYQTIHAQDGVKGMEMAFEHIPDIIISDVMMPNKNGYEVCAALKTDERTDHIPIILLTAKVTTEDRLEGLTQGADAYLAKPFNKDELFTRLDQLLLLRKKLISKLEKNGFSVLLKEREVNPQTKFLQQVITIVHSNIDNSNFGPSLLAEEMHLSESQIYRKLKSITDKSTAIFIRSVRLQKAKEMLQNSNKTVSEIAYEVGFNDPSWFSRSFKEEFGIPPSSLTK